MTALDVASARDLAEVLPHRAPMLLVDHVELIEPRARVRAVKTVAPDDPWTAATGTFPTFLLIESWCQSAGLMATWADPNPDVLSGEVMLFAGLSDITVGPAVRPGARLVHEARVERDFGATLVFSGHTDCDGERVLDVGSITVAFRPAAVLQPDPRPGDAS